jgi:hypothetical protein
VCLHLNNELYLNLGLDLDLDWNRSLFLNSFRKLAPASIHGTFLASSAAK